MKLCVVRILFQEEMIVMIRKVLHVWIFAILVALPTTAFSQSSFGDTDPWQNHSTTIITAVETERPLFKDPTQQQPNLANPTAHADQGLEQLQSGMKQLSENLTISTVDKKWKIGVFGSLSGEMLFAESRPILSSGIVLISPDFGKNTSTFAVHGKSTNIGAAFVGPEVCGMKLGGTFLSYFYGEQFLQDLTGFYVVRGFGELKNEHQRISFGLEGDLINPIAPTTLNFNQSNGAGNLGYFRGNVRFERYIHFNDCRQLTLQAALSNPITTAFTEFGNPPLNILEDNGYPNLEMRAAIGFGPKCKRHGQECRLLEWGVSGLLGQLRRTALPANQEIDVAAIGSDLHWIMNSRSGIKAEFFHGQGLGNYNAGVFQIFNSNADPVYTNGGFAEYYIYWNPCLHSHFGFGIDDPLDFNLDEASIIRNEMVYANLIYDVTNNLELGFEISRWETTYHDAPSLPPAIRPGDNSSMIYHSRVRLKF